MATRRVDDSDESEATALDLRPSSRSARPGDGPSAPRAPAPPKPPRTALPRRAPLADHSDDDEEATEFLSVRPPPRDPARAPSSEAVPRAKGRAVPIEPLPIEPLPLPPTPLPPPAPSALPAPLGATPSSMVSTEPIRPLPHRTIASDVSATGTASVPRVTRIHVVATSGSTTNGDDEVPEHGADIDPDTTIPPDVLVKAPPPPPPRVPTKIEPSDDETVAGEDPDETQAPSEPAPSPPPPSEAPPHRRLPMSAEGDVVPARRSPSPVAEPHDGILVVDAPAEATVIVNGVERGRGMVRVGDLDREARHAVRIHCAGFAPWSGSVSLQGKPAAKIRPTLKPRAR